MGVLPKEEGQWDGWLLPCRQGFEGYIEICMELFTGKGNERKAGLSAGMGPCNLGSLYPHISIPIDAHHFITQQEDVKNHRDQSLFGRSMHFTAA